MVVNQHITENYAIYNADCIEGMKGLRDGSVGGSIYSPPFFVPGGGGMYHYSSDDRDLSNADSYEKSFEHYEFVVREIHRLTMPGRFTAVHCMDVPMGNSGSGDYLVDFPGDIIRLHQRLGWKFKARHTIWKEPLWVRLRTMAKSLAHKTIVEDSANCGVANGDYLLIFQRDGANPEPIKHPTGLDRYAGECPMPADILRYRGWTGKQTENRFSHWIWRRYASCIWDDIRMGKVLEYKDCKEEDDEKHVHPLQLDVIERFTVLRTNPGDVVLTPFMGVGSECYGALMNGRRAIGFELKSSYYRQAVANLAEGEREGFKDRDDQIDLFGDEDLESALELAEDA